MKTAGDHKLYFSGHERLHIGGVSFLVNKAYTTSLIECRPLSDRIITLRLKASPKNLTIIQQLTRTKKRLSPFSINYTIPSTKFLRKTY